MYQYRHIRPINEFRNQMEIPFDGKHPIKGKPPHVHLMDAIKQMDIKAPCDVDGLYSEQDPQKLFNKYYHEAFELYLTNNEDFDDHQSVLDQLMEDEDDGYWSEPTDDIDPMDVESYLTTKGKLKFREYMREIMDTCLLDYNFMESMSYDKENDGLIDIWRAIILNDGSDDLYSDITGYYGGLGHYWSWKESGAYPHSADAVNISRPYIIHAKICPEDINWEQTIYKNAWYLRAEMEIEVDPNSPILIKSVTTYKDGKTIKLNDKEYMAST